MAARRRLQFIVRAHLFAISYGTELQLYALFALLAKLWGTLRKKKKGKAEIRFPLVDGAEDAFMASRARQASGKTLATKSRLQPRKTRLLQGAPTSAVAGPAALFFACCPVLFPPRARETPPPRGARPGGSYRPRGSAGGPWRSVCSDGARTEII